MKRTAPRLAVADILPEFSKLAPLANDSMSLAAGVIALANESRYSAATYSEPLTEFTIGWKDPNNYDEMLNYIAPGRSVPKRFEFKKAKADEVFVSDAEDAREIGTSFKELRTSGETVNAKTQNRGLTYTIDMDDQPMSDQDAVALLMQRLKLNKLRRAFAVLLAAAGAGTGKVWNNTATPDLDLDDAVAAYQLATGLFPNRGVMGLPAWTLRKKALAPQNNAGAKAGYALTPTEVGRGAGLDDLKLSRELFQVTTAGKQRVLAANLVVFTAFEGVDKNDPSNIKGFWTPCEGGTQYRVYVQEIDAKRRNVTVEHYDLTTATSSNGIQRYNITAS